MYRNDWITEAACSGLETDLWYGDSDGFTPLAGYAIARQVCVTCPSNGLDGPCLKLAMTAEWGESVTTRYGIFAGLDGKERKALELQRKADAQAKADAEAGVKAGT